MKKKLRLSENKNFRIRGQPKFLFPPNQVVQTNIIYFYKIIVNSNLSRVVRAGNEIMKDAKNG